MPVSLGYCPFHLANKELPASGRMQHFLRAVEWKDHINEELSRLKSQAGCLKCPLQTPRCGTYSRLQDLKFHLKDIHGIDALHERHERKRAKQAGDTNGNPKRQKRDKSTNGIQFTGKADGSFTSPYLFVNLIPESLEEECQPGSPKDSLAATELRSSSDSLMLDNNSSRDTPPSSPCSDIINKIEPSDPNLSSMQGDFAEDAVRAQRTC